VEVIQRPCVHPAEPGDASRNNSTPQRRRRSV
jgi:hypothetical protein